MSGGDKRLHPAVQALLDCDPRAIREVLDMNPDLAARLRDALRRAEAVSSARKADPDSAPATVRRMREALEKLIADVPLARPKSEDHPDDGDYAYHSVVWSMAQSIRDILADRAALSATARREPCKSCYGQGGYIDQVASDGGGNAVCHECNGSGEAQR